MKPLRHSSSKPSHYNQEAEHYDAFNEKNSWSGNQVRRTREGRTMLRLHFSFFSLMFIVLSIPLLGNENMGNDQNIQYGAYGSNLSTKKITHPEIGLSLNLPENWRCLNAFFKQFDVDNKPTDYQTRLISTSPDKKAVLIVSLTYYPISFTEEFIDQYWDLNTGVAASTDYNILRQGDVESDHGMRGKYVIMNSFMDNDMTVKVMYFGNSTIYKIECYANENDFEELYESFYTIFKSFIPPSEETWRPS